MKAGWKKSHAHWWGFVKSEEKPKISGWPLVWLEHMRLPGTLPESRFPSWLCCIHYSLNFGKHLSEPSFSNREDRTRRRKSISGFKICFLLWHFCIIFSFFNLIYLFNEFPNISWSSHCISPPHNLEIDYLQVLGMHVGQISVMPNCDTDWNELMAFVSCRGHMSLEV